MRAAAVAAAVLALAGAARATHLPPRFEGFRIAFADARHGVMSATRPNVPCPNEVCTFFVYATADGGRTWRRTLAAPLSAGSVAELAAAPGTSSIWAGFPCDDDAPCRPRLFRSGDGGRTWRRMSYVWVREPAFASPAHGWAIGRFGAIVATADGGRTWTRVRNDPCPDVAAAYRYVARVSASRGWVLCRDDTFVPRNRALYETLDNGRSWRLRAARGDTLPRVGRGFDAAFAFRTISFRPSGRGWIWRYATAAPIVTTDGGRSWRAATKRWPFASMTWGTAPTDSVAVAIADTTREQLVVRTADGGRTWRVLHRWRRGAR